MPVDLVILSLCRDLHLLAPHHPQSLSSAAGMLPIATLPIWIPGAYSVTDLRCPYRVTHHTVVPPTTHSHSGFVSISLSSHGSLLVTIATGDTHTQMPLHCSSVNPEPH